LGTCRKINDDDDDDDDVDVFLQHCCFIVAAPLATVPKSSSCHADVAALI
jgi:hypothetical protein